MAKVVNVSFPSGTEPLYGRLKKSKPVGVPLATHARNLLQVALDATVGRKK